MCIGYGASIYLSYAQITRNHRCAWYMWAHELWKKFLSLRMLLFRRISTTASSQTLEVFWQIEGLKKMLRVDLHDLFEQYQALRTQPTTSIKNKNRSTSVNKPPDFDNDLSPTQPVISTKRQRSYLPQSNSYPTPITICLPCLICKL